nr:hypothetical protein [Tanacetum cinerariifolium]
MDTLPYENTSEIPVESKSLGSTPKLIPVRRSERTTRAPNRLCLNIEVEDDELGDLGEPANYKAAMLDPNKVVRSKWLYKKKTNMDGKVHTYKARLVAKGYTQTYRIDYEETFSPDLGEAAYILGIKIYRDRSRRLIGVGQSAYIDKILKKYNMHNSKKGYFPMEVKHDLSNELCDALAVGSIMYVVRCTRPDVAFAQNLVSRYQQNPRKLHWVAIKHILKYLRNTRDMFLVYEGKPDTEPDVTSFCDASWQCDKDDTKKFFRDLGVMPSINKPINMYYDNSAAIIFANEPGIIKGARHFLLRYHYVREQVETGEIKLIKVHTDDKLADTFTKALPRGMVIDHAKGIRL